MTRTSFAALAQASPPTRELQWFAGWDPWLQALVWGLVALTIALTLYNYRQLRPWWRRATLLALRAVTIIAIVAVFYQPALLEEQVARSKNHVAVFLDVSESMGLPHGSQRRIDLAERFVRENDTFWSKIRDDNTLSFHMFGDRVRTEDRSRAELEPLRATDRRTDIKSVFDALQMRSDVHDLGGVIIVTDGMDTEVGPRVGLTQATRAMLKELAAPIHAFTPQGQARLKDVAIDNVAYNNFAFAMNASSLQATIRVHGYGIGRLGVSLTRDGRQISRTVVDIIPGRRVYDVSFDWVPKKLGKRVLALSVDHLEDEVYGGNNRREFIVNVLRDKVRVLQIVGQPSWDERFLRNHLKQDPNVDLISFFILVNPYGVRPRSGETALIPFPARELFEEELGGFDLVIFQNFNYGPFQTRQYLPRIPPFVKQGGAFLMVGGPLSFSAGGYYGTPVTEILPVELPQDFGTGVRYGGSGEDLAVGRSLDTTTFQARLTQPGEYHPVTRLALDPSENRARWAKLSELEGINKVTRPKANSLVLVEHPELTDSRGKAAPVVAVAEMGKGRTMAVMTDSTWHWGFKAGNEGGDPGLYDEFWSNAIRWLIKDPELDLVRVRARQDSVRLGQNARVRIDVFKADYRPASRHDVRVVVRRRGVDDGPGQGGILRESTVKTDGEGRANLSIPVTEAGIYEVTASADVVAGRATEGRDLFVASGGRIEFDRVVDDGAWIDALVTASGGEVHDIESPPPTLSLRPPRVSKVTHRKRQELWNSPISIAIIVALFGIEWWIRRRWGYL